MPDISKIQSKIRAKVIALILFNMLIFWLLTINKTKITNLPPDCFYYVESLPLYYWIGFFLGGIVLWLLFSSKIEAKAGTLFEVSLITLLLLYFFGTPTISYANPRFLDTYGVIDRYSQIIEAGYIIPTGGYDKQYPLLVILCNQISQIVHSDVMEIAKLFPLLHVGVVTMMIYITAREITTKFHLFAPVIYLSISWLDVQHLSPQSYGLMLTSVFLFFVITRFTDKITLEKSFLLVLIIAATVLAHPITPLINLLPLLFIWILSSAAIRLKGSALLNSGQISTILLLQAIMYFGHLVENVHGVLGAFVSEIQSIITNFMYQGAIFVIADFTITNPMLSYDITFQLRRLSLLFIFIIGLISIIFILLKNINDKICLLISCIFLGYVSLFVSLAVTGNMQFIDRGFIFSIIPLALLIPKVLDMGITNKTYRIFSLICIAFLIFHLLLFPILSNGVDPYMVPSESELAGKDFIIKNPELQTSINFQFYGSPAVFNNYWYNYFSLKHQKGDEYTNQFNFNGLDMIYNSDQAKIFYQKDKQFYLKFKLWRYAGYREL